MFGSCSCSSHSIFFSCYLSIQRFCYGLSVFIFWSRIHWFVLYPVVDLSLCFGHQRVGKIFFRYFRIPGFICITWPSWVSSFATILWFISFTRLARFVCGCLFFYLFILLVSCRFIFLITFSCCHRLFICPSIFIFHLGFVFLFGFFRGMPFLSLSSFAPA